MQPSKQQQEEILRAMWLDHTALEIGDALGVTLHCVESRARALGLPKKRQPIKWCPGEVDAMLRMVAEGASSREIGNYLGKTRNAVLGKLFRLGVSCKTTIHSNKPLKPRQKTTKPFSLKPAEVVKLRVNRPKASAPTNDPVHILLRKESQCAFIVGHHLCCGAEAYRSVDGLGHPRVTSWCPYHYNIVFKGKDAA